MQKGSYKTTTIQTGNKKYYKINHNKVYNLVLKFSTQLKDSEKSLTRKSTKQFKIILHTTIV